MKRYARIGAGALLAVVLVASVAAVAIGAASGGTTNAQGGPNGPAADQYGGHDSLLGSGQRLSLSGQLSRTNVSAYAGSAGENARGTFQVFVETADLGTVAFRGTIHCLTVVGNHAAARGTVEKSTAPPVPVGTEYQIQVTDNKASRQPDTNINFYGFDPGDTGCAIIPFDEIPITKGNFTVHDVTG